MDLSLGTVLNQRYAVETILGHGGLGITCAAQDRTLQVRVAVKKFLKKKGGWSSCGRQIDALEEGRILTGYGCLVAKIEGLAL